MESQVGPVETYRERPSRFTQTILMVFLAFVGLALAFYLTMRIIKIDRFLESMEMHMQRQDVLNNEMAKLKYRVLEDTGKILAEQERLKSAR